VKIKTSEIKAEDGTLDWAVAKCENQRLGTEQYVVFARGAMRYAPGQFSDEEAYTPSTNWSQGGPLIEREEIQTSCQTNGPSKGQWGANMWFINRQGALVCRRLYGKTLLIAAMRCYVASKLGDEIDVPEELK